jgi:formylglycine-generating enzyme required for sulfatase activity
MNKDGVFLGRATASFQVTVSADDLKKKEPVKLSVVLQAARKELGLKESVDVSSTVTGGKAPFKYAWTGVTKTNGSSAVFTATEPGVNTISITVTDSSDATGSASISVDVYDSNLALRLKSDKPELTVLDIMDLSATVTGGKAPYVIKWGLGIKGTAEKAVYTPTACGDFEITATVTDANKKTASASLPIKVLPVKLSIDGLPKSVVFGKTLKVKAINSAVLTGKNPLYIWTSNATEKIGAPTSNSPENSFCMKVLGAVKIGLALSVGNQIIGTSPDYTVEVTAPKITLSVSPSKPKVGDTVTVSAALSESIDNKLVQWRWVQPKTGKAGSDTMSFKLEDERPVTVLVELANTWNGQTISKATLNVTAGKSEIQIPDEDTDESTDDPIPVLPKVEPGKISINPKDGAKMVWIAEGEFLMGSTDAQIAKLWSVVTKNKKASELSKELFQTITACEKPQRTVYLNGYWMYVNEVTVAQYKKFCSQTGRNMPKKPLQGWKDDQPMVNVTWQEAVDYTRWAGVFLPTEAQWEKAARGTDGRIWPWGDTWDRSKCISGHQPPLHTRPVASCKSGASPYGCLDMAGNAEEWCLDGYADDYYKVSPLINPTGPDVTEYRVLRGGKWSDFDPDDVSCARRSRSKPTQPYDWRGFRCVSIPGARIEPLEVIPTAKPVTKQTVKPVVKSTPKTKPSPSTASATVKMSVTFYNGDSKPLHMFMKSEGFNQGNKTAPFGLHIEDYQVKPGSTVVFCAGRDGKVLYTGTYKVPSIVDGISVNYKLGQGLSFGED